MGTAGARQRRVALQVVLWRRPEWWTVGLSASAWALLAAEAVARGSSPDPSHHHHHHAGPGGSVASERPLLSWEHDVVLWTLMVVAMMPPLVLAAIRAAARLSLWSRRNRAIGGFLVGYLSPWIVGGLAVSALVAATGLGDRRGPWAAALAFGLAAGWQLTGVKRRALWSCHRTASLSPEGWRADRDCVRYGYAIGTRCLLSCWAMMLGCVLGGHTLGAMAGVGVLGAVERYAARPRQRAVAGGLVGLAAIHAALAVLGT